MAVQMPVPIQIEGDVKEIKLEAEVIDLDDYLSSEERIRRWNSKVRRKNQPLCENDEDCDFFFSIMKWYTVTLAEDIIDTDICENFIQHLNSHLNFYCYTFVKSKFHGFTKEQYLSHMEDILAMNLDYEVKLFMKDQKRYKKLHRKKMLRKLQTLLFYDTDSYFNVLLKVQFNRFGICSEASKIYWNFIFKFVLSKGPKSTTDLDFARAYFLHKKWKKVNSQTFDKIIDDMLFTTYSRGPEDIESNQHIQEILRPPKEVLGFLAHQTNDKDHCKNFLAYVIKMKEEETMRLVTQVLEKDDSEREDSIVESQEDVKLEDDDCILIEEGTVRHKLKESEILVHEIFDDEDDIASIEYYAPKESIEAVNDIPSGFLESISIPESSADKENRNPKEKSIFGPSPVPQHSFKLQSSNSVQSREKQSRKFTRKKAVDSTVASLDESIDLDSVESLEHPSIDIIDDEQVMHLGSDDDQSPPFSDLSPSFSDIEIRPTNSILETCHSTLSSNSDLCNVPTSEQTYISPTSPDISSTFEPIDIEQEESEENSVCENETEKNSVCENEAEENSVCENEAEENSVCENEAEENSVCENETEENSVCAKDTTQSIKDSTKTAGSAIIRRILKDFSIETADSIQNTLISTNNTKNNTSYRWYSSTPTDLNSSVSVDEATSSTKVSTNVMTEDSTTQKEKAAVTKTVTRRNGHIEHNNNDVNKDPIKNMVNKQLYVRLTTLDLRQEKSGDKILFTSKSKLTKFEEKNRGKFKALTKEDGLDDGLTGDLGKISSLSDMSIILDLFEESSSHKPNNNTNVEFEGVNSNSDVDQGCNKDTAKSIVSPENDDFNRSLYDFPEHRNKTSSIPARKSQEKQEEEVPTKKRKICFAEKLVVDTAVSDDNIYPKSYKHQGVLKKLKTKLRIPPNTKPLQSFSDYGIQTTDPLLQADSLVVVNRLSDEELDKWRKGKTCDDTKIKKTEKIDLKPTVLMRVDYDKDTKYKGVCKGDRVLYNDGLHRELPELINAGTVDSKTDDVIQPICESICCSKLLLEFKKLRICKTGDVPKISSNPFSFKISEKEKIDNSHRLLFIDRSSVNKVAEKIATIPDSLDIVQQPAIVPEVEEFEKTMGKEEVAKVSTIPSDLHNLNLRKFSPSPVMNCFSPHSPNYSYFSDNSNFAEKSDSFQESDDIDIENNLILDNQELIEKKEEGQENQELIEKKEDQDVPRNEEARKEVSEATVWIEIAEQCITEPSPSLETNEPLVWDKTIDTIIASQSDKLQNQSIIWVNPIENTVVTSESLRQNETINESLIWVQSVEDTVVSTQSVCESMMWIKPIETTVAPSHNDSVVWTKQSEDSIVTSLCQNQAINVWVEPIKETSIPNSVTWVKAADSTVTICPINEPNQWDKQADDTIDNASTIPSNALIYAKAAEDVVCAKQAMPESTTETTITSESTNRNQLTDKPIVWIKPLVETIDTSQTVTSSQPINESMVWHETVEPICQNQPNDPVIWIKTMAEAVDTPQTVTSTQPTTDSMIWIKPSDETVVTTVSQAQPIAWIKSIENTVDTAQRSNQSMEWAKPTGKTSQTVCSNQPINESLVWAKSTEETVVSSQPIPDQTMNELLVWIKPMKDHTTESESTITSQQSNCSYQDIEIKTDANSNIEEYTRLPLKKRKRSVKKGNELDEEIIAPEMMEEILKRARAEKVEKVDISYPATPAISIAEIQETLEPPPRTFKTPAQKKEMPPAPVPATSHPQQKIVTEQYNNHTYNNPTINYHMNNVPYPFFPCPSLSYFPSILVPVNGTTTFDVNVMNTQQAHGAQPMTTAHQEPAPKVKKEKRGRRRKRD